MTEPMADPHIAWAFVACMAALFAAIIQLSIDHNRPPPKEPPSDYPILPV